MTSTPEFLPDLSEIEGIKLAPDSRLANRNRDIWVDLFRIVNNIGQGDHTTNAGGLLVATSRGSQQDVAYNYILTEILEGRLPAGSRVTENEFEAAIGVSRTPIRGAITQLVAEGLLSEGPSGGRTVCTVDREQLRDVLGVREYLEGAAAALAARFADEGDIDALEKLAAKLSQPETLDDGDYVETNLAFHRLLAQVSRNRYLDAKLLEILRLLKIVTAASLRYPTSERVDQASSEHLKIAEALRKRDANQAEMVARQHARSSAKYFMENFQIGLDNSGLR